MANFVLVLSLSLAIISSVQAGCPFKDAHEKPTEKVRGHGDQFGYHARNWKRIETLYEHPHPEEFYEKYMRGSKPVIIRGGAGDWPALKKWTNLTYLKTRAGDGRGIINWKKMYGYDKFHPVRVQMSMKEFTDKFEKDNLYMDTTLPTELAEDVYWPKSLGCQFYLKRSKQLAIMFNNGKSSSDYHVDSACTYFVQVTGSRRWLLTPPTEVEKVYSGTPSLVDHYGISAVNQTHVDLEKTPLVKDLSVYLGYMNPGDIIYVPEGWHHQVNTYGSPNIGAVVFLNYLLCEFNSEPDDVDIVHVRKCVFKYRNQRPKKLKCDMFDTNKLDIHQLIAKHKPVHPQNFASPFHAGSLRKSKVTRIMNNGEKMPNVGVSLVGHGSKKINKLQVFKAALREGFRLYCVSTADRSAKLLGLISQQTRKVRGLDVLAYIPKSDFGTDRASKAIDSLLTSLNRSYVDILLMQTDYCPAENGTRPCQRKVFSPEMLQTWRVMEKAFRDKKVKTLGVSDFSLWELKELMKVAKVPVTIARARMDPFFRNVEFRDYCMKKRILFMARSVLGRQWKQGKSDYPPDKDIFKQYYILSAAFQYKTSVHGVLYDWAVKKAALICPTMDDPLHVRVSAQAFRTESDTNPDKLMDLDKRTDTSGRDVGLFAPENRNHFEADKEGGEIRVGDEEFIDSDKLDWNFNNQIKAAKKVQKDFSQEVYTDKKDFERFPTYMQVRNSEIP